MPSVHTTLKDLSLEEAAAHVEAGAAYTDLRSVRNYLDAHIPGSLSLQYEFGPGFPVRARDCIPLETPLVLLDHDVDMQFAAASLRGKGFAILGFVKKGLTGWAEANGHPASTSFEESATPPAGTLLQVGDPGSARIEEAQHVPTERMWTEAARFAGERVVLLTGRGLRAALAVGMLERAGAAEVLLWKAKRS
jgi:rhodanese-related sulfurtransferase